MTKRKRPRGRPADRAQETAPEKPTGSRPWWPWVAAGFAVLAIVLIGRSALRNDGVGRRTSFPEPRPYAQGDHASPPSYDEFVGSDECEECHKAEYDAWKASTHGNAGGQVGEVRILAPFDGTPIRFRDGVVTALTLPDGRLAFRVAEQGRPEQLFEVAGVVGGGHMVGGGTQGFFAEFPDGTTRFLPFDFDRQEGVWFCQTAGRANLDWTPIRPDMALSDCNDWPPSRVLGSNERFANCQNCHGSQITLRYDAEAQRYQTRFTTLAINCESCHGPGRRHLEIARSDSIDSVSDIGAEALATYDKNASLGVCFQCHAVKAELRPGFISGMPLQGSFSELMMLLSYRPYFPDGRIRLFAYQQQHIYSDCYLNGSMTCVDCHDPHSQRYRDIWGEPLVGRFSDGQCLDCHASKAEEQVVEAPEPDSVWSIDYPGRAATGAARIRINSHTFHPVGAPGGRCIDCHMPYQQEPEVGERLRYSRSDHTVSIPRPGLDGFFGIENACVKCHRGLSLEQVQEQISDWYGELKPPKSQIRGLVEARGIRDPLQAARLMLVPEEDADYVALEFTNLSYFLLTYLRPDMPALDPEVVDRLKQLAESEDLDLQALALASLHFARGNDPAVRSYLAGRLRGLGERDGAVRRRWVWALSFLGESSMGKNELQAAVTIYRKAAEILPDDAEVLRKLGIAYGYLGDYTSAVGRLRRSRELDPGQVETLENLGLALAAAGDLAGSLAVFRQAVELNPWEPKTYVSLGNTLLRTSDVDGAIEAYRRAVSLDPSLAEAHFSLAGLYQRQGHLDEAMAALERGLEFDRGNAAAREALARLRGRRTGQPPDGR